MIDLSADRAAFVCQSQSLNLFVKNPTYKTLNAMHFYSWKKGLKTGIYYLRSQAKTSAQKFSVDLENVKNKEETGVNGLNSLNSLNSLNAIMNINSIEKGNTKINQEPAECLMCSS